MRAPPACPFLPSDCDIHLFVSVGTPLICRWNGELPTSGKVSQRNPLCTSVLFVRHRERTRSGLEQVRAIALLGVVCAWVGACMVRDGNLQFFFTLDILYLTELYSGSGSTYTEWDQAGRKFCQREDIEAKLLVQRFSGLSVVFGELI